MHDSDRDNRVQKIFYLWCGTQVGRAKRQRHKSPKHRKRIDAQKSILGQIHENGEQRQSTREHREAQGKTLDGLSPEGPRRTGKRQNIEERLNKTQV